MVKYSVKTKLIAITLMIFAAAAVLFSLISYYAAKHSAETVVKSLIEQSAVSAADALSGRIDAVTAVADDISKDLAMSRAVDDFRMRLLEKRNESYAGTGIEFDIVNASNMLSIDGITDYSDNEAVISAVRGIPYMTAPFDMDGQNVVTYSAPLNYFSDDRACVIVCTARSTFFDDTFSEISLGKSCAAYVCDENGIIAGSVSKNSSNYSATAKISERDGWILCVEADPTELMPDLTTVIISAVALSALLALLLCAVIAAILSKTLSPIKPLAKRISALADGDFTSPVPMVNSHDESAAIAEALNRTVKALNGCVREITTSISSVADGNISDDKTVYKGDFVMIHDALSDVRKTLRSAISRIRRASDSVLNKASKINETIIIEPIKKSNTSAHDFFKDCPDITKHTARTSAKLEEARNILTDEQKKLVALTEVITAMTAYTNDITDIVSDIEDIAFQTNILALNAAIEASTAGEYGRGFAIVADEVRALAQKSAESAKSTSELIEATVSSITRGNALAKETSELLEEAIISARKTADCMNILESAAEDYSAAAESAEEMIIQLSISQSNAVQVDAKETNAIITEAQRLKKITDTFKT